MKIYIRKNLWGNYADRVNRDTFPSREYFITLRHINYFKAKMDIQKQAHPDDAKSLSIKIYNLDEENYTPLLIYQPLGSKHRYRTNTI